MREREREREHLVGWLAAWNNQLNDGLVGCR
jgi:hypothetical protein